MLKVGIIGAGSIFKGAHLPAYERIVKENGPAVIEAICDICPETMEGMEGVRVYTDADEMLEKEKGKLDYIDICVPTFLHAEIAIKDMEAGFPVLSEKPMARTVEQAQAMIDASKRTGKKLMIAYCNRFYDAARRVKELIDTKELGEVHNAEFRRAGGSGSPTHGWNNWFRDGELSGGAILDLHIHDVDMIRWMFGMPNAVTTAAASYITKNGYDVINTNYLYDNNVFVNASCDWTTVHDKFDTRVIRVNFDKGYVMVERTAGRKTYMIVEKNGTITDYLADGLNLDEIDNDSYYNEIMYFVDCLIHDKPVDCCMPEESKDSVKIIMAEIASADKNGERVEL